MSYFEENMKALLGDDYTPENELKKADPIDEAVNFLIKGEEPKAKKEEPKKEEKKELSKNTTEKSGLIPKDTEVFSSVKEKKFIMTRDHHTSFLHDVGSMLIFEWNGDTFYVKKTNVEDYEDGSIMKPTKEEAKKKKKVAKKQEKVSETSKEDKASDKKAKEDLKKAINTEGIKDTKVVNKYVFLGKIKNSLGYKRDQMPQISSKDLDKLLVHFGNKTKVKDIKKKVNSIKFAQGEINEEKVLDILGKPNKIKKMLKRTYVISLDGYLLDGHHGISALLEENGEKEIKAKRISLPFKQLKKRVNQMKISKKVDLDDKKHNISVIK